MKPIHIQFVVLFRYVLIVILFVSGTQTFANIKYTDAQAQAAYRLLELEFGTPLEKVKQKRKSLVQGKHPDSKRDNTYLKYVQEVNAAVTVIKGWLNKNNSASTQSGGDTEDSSTTNTENVDEAKSIRSGLDQINRAAYLQLLFQSQFYRGSTLSENLPALFELIYRLYSTGYTHDVLAYLRSPTSRISNAPEGFQFGAAFPRLRELFADRSGQLVNHFQVFKSIRPNYGQFSHILVHFDAATTNTIGLPRFRIFYFKREDESAIEMMSIYRNHNNQAPRLQSFKRFHHEALYSVDQNGNRRLLDEAHDAANPVTLSILDNAIGGPPIYIDLSKSEDAAQTTQQVADPRRLRVSDLGVYLQTTGQRLLQVGYETGSLDSEFDRTYFALGADEALTEIKNMRLLEKLERASAEHFIWPQVLAPMSYSDVESNTDENANGSDALDSSDVCLDILKQRIKKRLN